MSTGQIGFSEAKFSARQRVTKREHFAADREKVVSWQEVLGVIKPYYLKGRRGPPPVGLERMLRVYLVQQCYGLSDEGAEDAITDSQVLGGFVRIDLSQVAVPAATTLLEFRHLLWKRRACRRPSSRRSPGNGGARR